LTDWQPDASCRAGFELANGLPCIGRDATAHALLAARSMAGAERLPVALDGDEVELPTVQFSQRCAELQLSTTHAP
jgi:hypothetical protein